MSTLEQLNSILRTVFDNPSLAVRPDTTADEVDGWDSLSHVNVVLAVEGAFQIRFSQKELLSFQKVGDMVEGIDRHLAQRRS